MYTSYSRVKCWRIGKSPDEKHSLLAVAVRSPETEKDLVSLSHRRVKRRKEIFMFSAIFTKEYWTSSFAKLKNTRYLAMMGLMIALKYILNNFRIPVADNLNIMLTFIPTAVEAAVIGPGAAIVSAVITDFLTGFLSPFGPYFPGYMLSKALGGIIFGLFFYRRKFGFWDVFIAKALINYIVNVGLGSLWSSMLYGKAFLVYASASIVKNTILLPIEAILLYALLRALLPALERRGIIKTA